MTRPSRTGIFFAALSCGLVVMPLASSCAISGATATSEISDLVRHGDYEAALDRAQQLVRARPDDMEVRNLYRDTRIHEMLSRCRQLVFAGHSEEGLAILHEAFDLDAQNPVVVSWYQKIRIQLAEDWLNRANELRNSDELDEARRAYEVSLAYVPSRGGRGPLLKDEARLGLAKVLLLQNYRFGLSKSKFDAGLRGFREYLLHQAQHDFAASENYDPTNERAVVRGDQVDVLLAEERLALAQIFEADGLFFAARNEYRLVLLVDPDSSEAKKGLDRMDREVRVTESLGAADMEIRRGNLDVASEILAESQAFTNLQGDRVQRLEGHIEDKNLELIYLVARNFERDYLYHEAVESYASLLELRPYYEDATARKKTIEEFIALTEEAYENASKVTDDEEAIYFLRQIQDIYWPEYLDVRELLGGLEARRQDSAQVGNN
jgi:hypothetical protein